MAQIGDTITYTYTDGTSVSEDISEVGSIIVEYMSGAGGDSGELGVVGGNGGLVENVEIDVSSYNNLYLWVASQRYGRYEGAGSSAAGSTEISFSNTAQTDSSDEPFLVGAGGGGDGGFSGFLGFNGGDGAARGGAGGDGGSTVGSDGNGTPPPQGGEGGSGDFTSAMNGDGAVASAPEILDSGTTTKGGGGNGTDGESAPENGEIKISYIAQVLPVKINAQDADNIQINGQDVTGIEINGSQIL